MSTVRYESGDLDGSEMVLEREDGIATIRIGPRTLMSSVAHDSEDELGHLVAEIARGVPAPRALIGGLGLGFTLRAALDGLPPDARVDVAELVPAVVRWNREDCGVYAGYPLDDPRVHIHIADVASIMAMNEATYDVIALDVDNGPLAITHERNAQLYEAAGLAQARAALRSGGVLAVWSAFASDAFTEALAVVGTVELVTCSSTADATHYIWLATKDGRTPNR